MRKLIENVELFFCDFDHMSMFKPGRAMRYFEKARFEVADALNIYEFYDAEDGVQFVVAKIRCENKVPIYQTDRKVCIVTQIETPEVGMIAFNQEIVQDGISKLSARFDIAVCSQKNGVLYRFNPELVERIRNYNSERNMIRD